MSNDIGQQAGEWGADVVGEPNPVVTESNMSAAERAVSAETPPASTPLPPQAAQTGAQPSSSQYKWLLVVSWTVPFIAVMLVIVYSIQYGEQSISVATTGALVGLAVLVVAALGGFLFGIPRALQQAPSANGTTVGGVTRYAINTNLEEISDWLTKIIVGVGLIQLGQIADLLGQLVESLAPGLGGQPSSRLVAGAELAFFGTWGFLIGYLLTRTYLTGLFRTFDVEQLTARVAKEAAESATKTAESRELERNQVDAHVLALIDRQLRARLTDETIDPVTLRDALQRASAPIREQAFTQAQAQRRENWPWRSQPDQDPQRAVMRQALERTIPIFEALIDAEADDARFHAELGYALKDKQEPALDRARSELSAAIRLAPRLELPTDYLHFNRALVEIELESQGQSIDRDRVLSDLRVALHGRATVREIVQDDATIQSWLQRHALSVDDGSAS